jgi:hypothetical protein
MMQYCQLRFEKENPDRSCVSVRAAEIIFSGLSSVRCASWGAGVTMFRKIVRPHYLWVPLPLLLAGVCEASPLAPLQPLFAGACWASPFLPPPQLVDGQPPAIMLVPARSPAMPIPARNFLSSCASMAHLLFCIISSRQT